MPLTPAQQDAIRRQWHPVKDWVAETGIEFCLAMEPKGWRLLTATQADAKLFKERWL